MGGISNAGEQARGGEGQQQERRRREEGEEEEEEEQLLLRCRSQSYTPQMFVDDLKKQPRKKPYHGPMYDDYHDRIRLYPLHQAVASGRVDIVQFMLDKGYDIDALDKHGRTPLQEALNVHCMAW